jgi:hypothetical protein
MVDVNTLTSLIGKTKLNTMGQLSVGVEGTGTGHQYYSLKIIFIVYDKSF